MRALKTIVCLSLCNLLSACGEGSVLPPEDGGGHGGQGGDGAGPAGGAESTSGGAEAGGAGPVGSTVKITVRDYERQAVEGLDVIANDETGALVAEAVTDEAGEAELTVPSGGSVSVLHENDYGWSKPGALARNVETLVFTGKPPATVAVNILVAHEPAAAGPSMTLDMWYAPRPGAATYQLRTSCGSSNELASTGITLAISSCTESGVIDAVLIARNAAGAIVDLARLDDLPFVPGAYQSHVLTWTGAQPSPVQFVLTNIPNGGGVYGTTTAREREPGGSVSIAANEPLHQAEGVATFYVQHMTSYGSEHCQDGTINLSNGELTTRYMRQRCGEVPDLSTLSVDAEHLTRFDPIAPEPEPHVLRWSAGEDAALGDVLLVEQLWYREEEVTGTWSVYLAPSVRDVAFPELPPALAAFALQASDVISNTKAVHQDFAEVDGFNAAIEKGVPELGEVSFEQYFSLLGD